jgi:hypothetical protein
MIVRFRIKKHERPDKTIVFIPEKLQTGKNQSQIARWKPLYDDKDWFKTFELAVEEISKFSDKLKKPPEIYTELPKMTMILYDDEPEKEDPPIPRLTHCFTDFEQIIEFCKEQNITNRYLVEGLENTKEFYTIQEKIHSYCG